MQIKWSFMDTGRASASVNRKQILHSVVGNLQKVLWLIYFYWIFIVFYWLKSTFSFCMSGVLGLIPRQLLIRPNHKTIVSAYLVSIKLSFCTENSYTHTLKTKFVNDIRSIFSELIYLFRVYEMQKVWQTPVYVEIVPTRVCDKVRPMPLSIADDWQSSTTELSTTITLWFDSPPPPVQLSLIVQKNLLLGIRLLWLVWLWLVTGCNPSMWLAL